MQIEIETKGDVTIVRLVGPADSAAAPELHKAFAECLRRAMPRIVCNLSGVDFICSDALGALISTHLQAARAGGFLRLVAPQQRVAEILATTQLNRLFTIRDSLAAALQA